MSDRIAATEGALRRGADCVGTAHQRIGAATSRVESELETIQKGWTGPASATYAGMMSEWQRRAAALRTVLHQLEGALRDTDRDQAATEQDQGSTISGLNSMMGEGR